MVSSCQIRFSVQSDPSNSNSWMTLGFLVSYSIPSSHQQAGQQLTIETGICQIKFPIFETLSSSRQASLNRSPYAPHVSSWNRNKFTWNLVLQSDRFGKPKHLAAGPVQPSKHSVGAGCYCWCPFYSCVIRSILCESPFWERIKLTGHHNCHFCI